MDVELRDLHSTITGGDAEILPIGPIIWRATTIMRELVCLKGHRPMEMEVLGIWHESCFAVLWKIQSLEGSLDEIWSGTPLAIPPEPWSASSVSPPGKEGQMNGPFALGTFLLGVGFGSLSVWLQQAPARDAWRLLQELETDAGMILKRRRRHAIGLVPSFGSASHYPNNSTKPRPDQDTNVLPLAEVGQRFEELVGKDHFSCADREAIRH
jgi:hypothetical protein